MTPTPKNDNSPGQRFELKRWLPLTVLAAGLVAFFALDLGQYLSFQALGQRRTELLAWVAEWPFAAPVVFMAAYAAVVALSLPIAVVFSLAAGFLFGAILGTIYTVVAAAIGATLVFLAARSALGEIWTDRVARRAGPSFRQMEAGFKANELNYLLFLRLVPIFPFWLVNLAAAVVGVRLRTFVIATLIGIIPGAVVYVNVGRGLGTIFDAGEEPGLENILSFDLLAAFSLLGLLALAPIAYRKFRARANQTDAAG